MLVNRAQRWLGIFRTNAHDWKEMPVDSAK